MKTGEGHARSELAKPQGMDLGERGGAPPSEATEEERSEAEDAHLLGPARLGHHPRAVLHLPGRAGLTHHRLVQALAQVTLHPGVRDHRRQQRHRQERVQAGQEPQHQRSVNGALSTRVKMCSALGGQYELS